MHPKAIALLAVLSVACASYGETVTLVGRFAGEQQIDPITTRVLLTPEPGAGRDKFEIDLPVPGRAHVDLSHGVKWTVEMRHDRFWARSYVVDSAEAAQYTFNVHPAGTITGRLQDERGQARGAELIVGFAPVGQQFPVNADTSRCQVDQQSRFTCTLPLGQHNLRFKTPGRTSVYRWSEHVTSALDVGDVRVTRGGTISAYVDLSKAGNRADLRVTVTPTANSSQSPSKVQFGPQGFFTTSALAPGLYDMLVEIPNVGVAAIPAIQVREGLEARLPRAITLEPRVAVTVRVIPPQPPSGSSWRLEFARAGAEGIRSIARGLASSEGSFVAENLPSGDLHVVVEDDRGSRWAARLLQVSPLTADFVIEIPAIYVEGTLRRGTERLKGFLLFGGEHGTPRIGLESDANGDFRGMLPRAGAWPVDVIIPPSDKGVLAKTVVDFDAAMNAGRANVSIPDTTVEGVVVDAAGRGVPGAVVTFSRGTERLGTVSTAGRGAFKLQGLSVGPARVVAAASGARSTDANVSISEDSNPPIRLVVQSISPIKSRVVGPTGPVPGAQIAVWPEEGGRVSLSHTDTDGYFVAMGHPQSQRLWIAVHSPGLALFLGTIPANPAQHPSQITLSSGVGVLEVSADSPVAFIEYESVRLPIPLALRILSPTASADEGMRILRLGDLPPGQYLVCSQHATAPKCGRGWLAPAGTLQLKIGAPE